MMLEKIKGKQELTRHIFSPGKDSRAIVTVFCATIQCVISFCIVTTE